MLKSLDKYKPQCAKSAADLDHFTSDRAPDDQPSVCKETRLNTEDKIKETKPEPNAEGFGDQGRQADSGFIKRAKPDGCRNSNSRVRQPNGVRNEVSKTDEFRTQGNQNKWISGIKETNLNAPLAGRGGAKHPSPGYVQVSGSAMQYAGYHCY